MTPSIFASRRLNRAERSELLRGVVRSIVETRATAIPVVVFDLDGTLLDNRPRVVKILHELADNWHGHRPEVSTLLRTASPERTVYGFDENLQNLGISESTVSAEAGAFWKARFFQDAYMGYDVEVPGALSFTLACYQAGASIVYLTGRDLPNMALGTFGSLRDLGFPIGVVGTSLVTKPTFEMPDTTFKSEVAPALSRVGKVVAVFDNEPANVNLMLDHHPDARAVFIDTQHAPDPPSLDDRALVVDSFAIDE